MINFLKNLFSAKELNNPVFCENCYYFRESKLGIEKCKHSANIKYLNNITYKQKGKAYRVKKPSELNKDNNCSCWYPSPQNAR